MTGVKRYRALKINTLHSKAMTVFSYMLLALGCGTVVGTNMVRVLRMPLSVLDRKLSSAYTVAAMSVGSISVMSALRA